MYLFSEMVHWGEMAGGHEVIYVYIFATVFGRVLPRNWCTVLAVCEHSVCA
jgi:hypothetical protein